MSISPIVKYIQKEFIEVYEALINNVDINMINDSYENFSPNMLSFIKKKDLNWFNAYFLMIDGMVKKGMIQEDLRKNLLAIKNSNKNIVNYIVDTIYDDDIINEQNKNLNGAINNIAIEEVINNLKWRKNQLNAVNNTIKQNFSSGIHYQVMDAGKIFIMLNTISEHYKLKPNNKLYIITGSRQMNLIKIIFDDDGNINPNKLNTFKYNNVIDLDKFNIINYTLNKNIETSNTKPIILIINYDHLRVMHKYNKIDYTNVNFVMLDECHLANDPQFYPVLEEIRYTHKISIIGFSATHLKA